MPAMGTCMLQGGQAAARPMLSPLSLVAMSCGILSLVAASAGIPATLMSMLQGTARLPTEPSDLQEASTVDAQGVSVTV